MNLVLRDMTGHDKEAAESVEREAMERRYLPEVFYEFLQDGCFWLAEVGGEAAGCGKFTLLPDGSAWLEVLRVRPRFQGMGVGKAFYRKFFEVAGAKGVKTMRMYTGEKNVVSKGLAERFGFTLAAVLRGMGLDVGLGGSCPLFQKVMDPERATELLMPLKGEWGRFVVMNRTFYELTPALCRHWCKLGMVYEDPQSGSAIALGARFMADREVHIAAFGGDGEACLSFAQSYALARSVPRLQCMVPPDQQGLLKRLEDFGFTRDIADYIVMEVKV